MSLTSLGNVRAWSTPREYPSEMTLEWSLGSEGALGTLTWTIRLAGERWLAQAHYAPAGGAPAVGAPAVGAPAGGAPAGGASGDGLRVLREGVELTPSIDDDLNLLHLDGPDLRVTLRGRQRPALLYARTPLLSTLGVPGGRASAPALVLSPVAAGA